MSKNQNKAVEIEIKSMMDESKKYDGYLETFGIKELMDSFNERVAELDALEAAINDPNMTEEQLHRFLEENGYLDELDDDDDYDEYDEDDFDF